MRRISSWAWFAALAAAAITGCDPGIYRAETVLNADGSVRRAIYQPVEATPAEARKQGLWTGSTYAERIPHKQWTGRIDALPSAEQGKDRNYFAAWGEFKSADQLPTAYVKQAPEGLPDGKLVVDYQREDLGLVVAYQWRETLTDIVTVDDMHQAREELADLLIPLGQKILERALGEEYDTTHLVDWCEHAGRPWFFELTDVLLASAGRGDRVQETIWLAVARVCQKHGLVLMDPAGKLFDDERMQAAVAKYAAQVLREKLRRHDGNEVPEEVFREIFQWIGLEDRPENSQEQFRKYDDAVKAAVAEKFGDDEKFGAALGPLATRILGLYASELFGSTHQFQYTLETPGAIVKTNGILVGERLVQWTFSGGDAYPFGYTMECESLDARTELVQQLLGPHTLETRNQMLDYIELVRSDEALRQAMTDSAAKKSMGPYYKARDASGAATKSEQAFKALGKLLKLPENPAGR